MEVALCLVLATAPPDDLHPTGWKMQFQTRNQRNVLNSNTRSWCSPNVTLLFSTVYVLCLFTEGNIEISLCTEMEVISYLNLGENLSPNVSVGLCAKAAGVWSSSHPAESRLSKRWHNTLALQSVLNKRIGLISIRLAETSPNATMRWWFWLFRIPFSCEWGWWRLENPSPSPHIPCPDEGVMDLLGAGCEFQLWHQPIDLGLFALLVSFLNPWSWVRRQGKIFPFCWSFKLSVMDFPKHSKGFAFSQFATLAIFCLISSQKITCCQLNTVCWWPINLWHAFGAGNEFINKL